MSILFPRIHPICWLGLLSFYVFSAVCGGPSNPEVSFAVLPLLGGIALGLGAAVGIWGAYKADKRAKEAMALQKQQEAERKASIKKYFGPEAMKAAERLEKGDYGFSDTRVRAFSEEGMRQRQAAMKSAFADLDRAAQMPRYSGRRERLKRELSQQVMGETGKSRLDAERLGEQVGAQQQAADRGTTQAYAGMLGGLQSSVPSMMLQTPSMGERMAGIAGNTLTSAAMMGAFSGPEDPTKKGSLSNWLSKDKTTAPTPLGG